MSTQAPSYKYVGDSHTWIRLTPGGEKTKVGHGEIIESNLPEKTFLYNGFRKVNFDDNGKIIPDVDPKANDEKAPKTYTAADLTKAMMKAIAEKHKVEIPSNAKNNAAILAVITAAVSPEDMAAEVALAFPPEEKANDEKVA